MRVVRALRRRIRAILNLVRKNAPEIQQPRAVQQVYLSMGWTTPAREIILALALEYIGSSQISGDYAEFGVWRGDTFATAYHFSKHLGDNFKSLRTMSYHAFDSFEGFPEPKGDDVFPQFRKGGRAYGVDEFNKLLHERNVPIDAITTNPGWFSTTLRDPHVLESIGERSISVAYVDCDLYESTKDVLDFLTTRIIPGGLILFDDWFVFAGHPYKGEQKACREWLTAHPEIALVPFNNFGWHGRSFIFHNTAPDAFKFSGQILD